MYIRETYKLERKQTTLPRIFAHVVQHENGQYSNKSEWEQKTQ